MTQYIEDRPVEAMTLLAGSVLGAGLKTVRLVPWGLVESKNGRFLVDDEAVLIVVQAFEKHRTDLPIDYEHQTLGGKYSSPSGRAPAAGWVKKMWGEAGRGLLALVHWNDKARAMIQAGEYRFLSPVVSVRIADRKLVAIHSAGLTNVPAIPGMEKLVASSRNNQELLTMAEQGKSLDPMMLIARIAGELGIEMDSVEDLGTALKGIMRAIERLKSAADSGGLLANALSLEAMADDAGGDGDGGSDGGTTRDLLLRLKELLGLEGPVRSEQILEAAIAKLEPASQDGGGEENEDGVVAAVRSRLGLGSDAGKSEVLLAMTLLERRGEAVVEQDASERRAKTMLAGYIAAGRIDPNDEPAVQTAMSLAREDPDRLEARMRKAPDLRPPQGRTKPPEQSTLKRTQVIGQALRNFRDDARLQAQTSEAAFVGLALREAGQPRLEDRELTQFV